MTKFIPYVLILAAAIAGIIVKFQMDEDSPAETSSAAAQTKNSNNNRIDNRYETILIYPKKNTLPEFKLTDQNNAEYTNKDFENIWSLIFIGYTNCPDVCPNTLNQMTQLYKAMDDKTRSRVQLVFLSVDPERDTPEHLAKYLDYFDANLTGISGDVEQLDLLVKALGGVYSINKEEGEYYTVDHSARIFLVGPKAERYGILESHSLSNSDSTPLLRDLASLVAN